MDFVIDGQMEVPEISDNEWADRFVNGYRQSFDKTLLEDADVVIARVFAKYGHAEIA
jgi:hypothetical protein